MPNAISRDGCGRRNRPVTIAPRHAGTEPARGAALGVRIAPDGTPHLVASDRDDGLSPSTRRRIAAAFATGTGEGLLALGGGEPAAMLDSSGRRDREAMLALLAP